MKLETRVKENLLLSQSSSPSCQEDTVQELTLSGNLPKDMDGAKRMRSLRDSACKIGAFVPRPFGIDKCPAGLPWHSAPITGYAEHIIVAQPLEHAICKEIVVYPDIIVHED